MDQITVIKAETYIEHDMKPTMLLVEPYDPERAGGEAAYDNEASQLYDWLRAIFCTRTLSHLAHILRRQGIGQ